jgi:hypothetical protein
MTRIQRIVRALSRRLLPIVAAGAAVITPLCTTGGGFPFNR